MEPLALLAVLVAIVGVGYIVVTILFNLLGKVIDFVEKNKFAIIIILVAALAYWLGHGSF